MRNEPQELTLLNNHFARLKFHSKNLPPTPQTQSNSYGPTGSPGALPPLTPPPSVYRKFISSLIIANKKPTKPPTQQHNETSLAQCRPLIMIGSAKTVMNALVSGTLYHEPSPQTHPKSSSTRAIHLPISTMQQNCSQTNIQTNFAQTCVALEAHILSFFLRKQPRVGNRSVATHEHKRTVQSLPRE